MRKKLLVAAALLSFTGSVEAATLANLEGLVFVDKGAGFRPAAGGDSVSPGDRVRVSQGAVNVVYSNGYSMPVGQNETAVVLAAPPDPAAANSGGGSVGGGAEGGSSWASTSNLLIVGGAVAIAGGIAGAVIANNNNNNNNNNSSDTTSSSRPASP